MTHESESESQEKKTDQKAPPPRETQLRSYGEIVVPLSEAPPPAPKGKKIHKRRPMPLVKKAPSELKEEEGE